MADGGHPIITVDAPPEGVRIGTPADVDDVMSVALMACEENGFLNPNPAKLLQEIWSALNLHYGVVGVIGSNPIEGGVVLRIQQQWYSDSWLCEEKAIFIRPEYRAAKGGRAGKLCDFSKYVADSLGLPLVIGVLSNHRTSAKVRMYERKFGAPAGAFFLYGAETGKFSGAGELK